MSVTAALAIGGAVRAESSSAATADVSVVFLVDVSTSMYGEPLAEAKRGLIGGTTVVPTGTHVGLRSFGGPCENNGVVRVPLGPFNRPTFVSAVEALRIGESGTPTPAALRGAAAMLPATGDRTIVLVSDGGSSCRNPCPTAEDLYDKLGAGFRIDTVGFRAPNSAESELACVAGATGGSYVPVKDAAGLHKTLLESAAARVTALRISPRRLTAARRGGSISPIRRRKVGARVTYSISKRVNVRFTVQRAAKGRLVGGTCRRPTRKNSHRRGCTRYVKLLGRFEHAARKGRNGLNFTGRLRARKLKPGKYRLVATAIDTAGTTAKPATVRFVIARR